MADFFSTCWQWCLGHKGLLIAGASGFVFFIFVTIGLVIFFIKVDSNFFETHLLEKKQKKSFFQRSFKWYAKNLIGIILVIAGFAMLFVPGPGILGVVVGLLMIDFPGRNKLIKKILIKTGALKKINQWRENRGKKALTLPDLQKNNQVQPS